MSGDLVLPDGMTLDVSAGTVLRFEPGAILLARGPVNLMGTASEPIVLGAQDAARLERDRRPERGNGIRVEVCEGGEHLWHCARRLDPDRRHNLLQE